MFRMDVSRLIANCREHAGLSQRELAARAGTSAAAICLYEAGDRIPRVDTLSRIVAAAGATLRIEVTPQHIDIVANGRTLAQLLELADHLPKRRASDELDVTPFHQLAVG